MFLLNKSALAIIVGLLLHCFVEGCNVNETSWGWNSLRSSKFLWLGKCFYSALWLSPWSVPYLPPANATTTVLTVQHLSAQHFCILLKKLVYMSGSGCLHEHRLGSISIKKTCFPLETSAANTWEGRDTVSNPRAFRQARISLIHVEHPVLMQVAYWQAFRGGESRCPLSASCNI